MPAAPRRSRTYLSLLLVTACGAPDGQTDPDTTTTALPTTTTAPTPTTGGVLAPGAASSGG